MLKENVKVTEFNVMGRIALSTVEFDIVKNGEVKTKKNNLATRCLNMDKFQERLLTRDHCDGVVIVGLYENNGEIFIPIIKEYRPASGYIWSFPAGQTEGSEPIENAVIRELKEETGLDAVVDSIVVQKPTYTSVGITDQRTCIAFSKCTGKVSNKYTTASEDITAKLFTVNDIVKLLKSDEEIACNTRLVLGMIALSNGNIDEIRKYL